MVNIKKGIVTIGIAIILTLFIVYGISLFVAEPRYEDFCTDARAQKFPAAEMSQNETACEQIEGAVWQNGYCDYTYTCNKEYTDASNAYNKTVFLISVVIGIVLLFVSFFIKQDAVSIGVLSGSILLMIYGVMRYWHQAADWLRFTILGIALIALVWVAIKKLNQ